MKKKKILILFRYIVGLFLSAFLVKKFFDIKVDFTEFSVIYILFLFGIIFHILSFFIVAYRIFYLVRIHLENYSEALKMYLIGWFFSNILPSNFGGDGYMVVYIRNKSKSLTKSIALISYQRILGLALLILYAFLYFILTPGWISKMSVSLNHSFSIIIVLVLILISIAGFIFFRGKIKNFILKYISEIRQIGIIDHLNLIFLSLLYQITRLSGFFFMVKSFDQSINIFALFFIMCMVSIGSMIPVSIGALGVQESLFTIGLISIGIPLPISILIAFFNRIIFLLFAIIGGVLFVFTKKSDLHKAKKN